MVLGQVCPHYIDLQHTQKCMHAGAIHGWLFLHHFVDPLLASQLGRVGLNAYGYAYILADAPVLPRSHPILVPTPNLFNFDSQRAPQWTSSWSKWSEVIRHIIPDDT